MAEERKVWGIRFETEASPKPKEYDGQLLTYRTYITDKREGLFVTSQAIRQVIKENGLKPQRLGVASYFVLPRMIFVQSFYPFTRKPRQPGLTALFEGKGIASSIELRIQRDLMKRFPGRRVFHVGPIMDRRRKQIEKRTGKPSRKSFPVEETFKQTLKYLRRQRAKKRKEKNKPRILVVTRRYKGK